MKSKLIKKSDGWYNLYDGEIGIGSTHAELQGHKLSKQNCDEIFGVVDVEKYVDEYDAEWKYTERIGFRDGFNKAMELNKDKVFTEQNLREAYSRGILGGDSVVDRYIKALQPTEIEVEIEMESMNIDEIREQGKGFLHGNTKKPKLDENGCLILKKI
jgi:hypothetical protein